MKNKKPQLDIIGQDGNAFAILGKAAKIAKANDMDFDTIQKEAMSGDYDNFLRVMMKYFDVN